MVGVPRLGVAPPCRKSKATLLARLGVCRVAQLAGKWKREEKVEKVPYMKGLQVAGDKMKGH